MLLTALAASPNTHPDTLAWLLGHVEDQGGGAGTLAIRVALAGNPGVPLDALRTFHRPPMADRQRDAITTAAFARPGLTGPDIIEILESDPRPEVLDVAMDHARFAHNGHVVLDSALDCATDDRDFADVLNHACVTLEQRVRAAAALAELHTPGSAYIEKTLKTAIEIVLGTAAPSELPATIAWARSAVTMADPGTTDAAQTRSHPPGNAPQALMSWLERTLDALPASPTPGTPAWFAHPSTTAADALAHLRSASRARSWRRLWPATRRNRGAAGNPTWALALLHHPDPDGLLAHAALHDPHLPRESLATIVARTRSRSALGRAARPLAPRYNSDTTLQHAVPLLTTADLVTLAVTGTNSFRYLTAALDRPDLRPEELGTLTAHWRALSAWPTQQSGLSPDVWGMRLLLHPNATPEQRAAGRDLVESADVPIGDGCYALLTLLGNLDLTNGMGSSAAAGACLPVNLPLRDYLAHIRGLRQAATDAYVTREDFADEVTRAALLALEPTFPGTLPELLDTARTLAL